MSHKGKTATELEQLRLAKSEECQKIFDAHKVEQDGKTTWDLTAAELDDVRARMAEVNAIGKARDEALETEQIAASLKSIQDDLFETKPPQLWRQSKGQCAGAIREGHWAAVRRVEVISGVSAQSRNRAGIRCRVH